MTTALRPLSTGELLDRTFSLYRSHFGLFVGIFALPYLVVLAYQLLGLVFQSRMSQTAAAFMSAVWGIGALLLVFIVSSASQAATVVAVSNLHLDRAASVLGSFSTVRGQFVGVVFLSLLIDFVVALVCGVLLVPGFVLMAVNPFLGLTAFLFIVPGIILFLMWSLAVPAKVVEHKGIFDSMSRSMELTKGSRGRIFIIMLLMLVLVLAITWLLQAPILIGAGFGFKAGIQRLAIGWQVAALVAEFISRSLVGAWATIALSLIYYDQRVRKEAFDLQLMMTTIDAATLPASPAQVGA